MLFILFFFFLLLMSDNFKTQLLWYYTKISTKIEIYFSKNKLEKELVILEVINLIKNKKISSNEYFLKNKKLILNFNSENDIFKIIFKLNNQKFRIILQSLQLKNFNFEFNKIEDPKYLSVVNQKNEDITNIINQYSGPLRNFYNNELDIEKLPLDKDFKNSSNFEIIDNLGDFFNYSKITDFIMYSSAN
jgi:hypothetical protein